MSAAQKRVAIAEDVVARILLGKNQPEHMTFGQIPGLKDDENGECIVDQKVLLSKEVADKKCTACAVGMGVISGMRLFNKVEVDQSTDDFDTEKLENWFSPSQVAMIELAFEEQDGTSHYGKHADATHGEYHHGAAIAFGLQFKNAKQRALAIWENVIRNNGEFCPVAKF